MATTYWPAPDSVGLLVNARIASHHEDFRLHGVRVGILFARNSTGPAVKLHGNACHATIRVVSHKDRVTKGYDAEMVIDERSWDGFEHRRRLALVAHELKHLMLVRKVDPETKVSQVQYDDGGRPKLKTRPGDWDAGDGFAEIVAEFGNDSIEFANIRQAWKLAESARDVGLPQPEPSLLDGVTVELRTAGTDGNVTSVTLTGETFGRLAKRFEEREANGDSGDGGTGGDPGEVADGGEVEDGEPSGDGGGSDGESSDDFGFGPSNPRYERDGGHGGQAGQEVQQQPDRCEWA